MISSKLLYFTFPLIIFQIFLLPGLLLSARLKLNGNIFNVINLSICLSLVINYIIVFILVSFDIYNKYLLWIIILFEIFYIYIYFNNLKIYLNSLIKITSVDLKNLNSSNLNKTIFFLSLIFFGIFLTKYFNLIKDPEDGYLQVFELGDALAYYSNWSKIWYNNIIPETVFVRPQLWPAITSIIYSFYANEYLEPLGKIIYTLIPGLIIIAIISLGISLNPLYILTGIIGLNYLIDSSFTLFTSGYIEFPLNFVLISFVSFYLIYFHKENLMIKKNLTNSQILILLSFVSLSVILTKEQGWIIFPFIFLILLFEKKRFSGEFIKNSLFVFLIIFAISFPFYFTQLIKYDFQGINTLTQVLFFDTKFHESIGHGENYGNIFGRISSGFSKVPIFLYVCLFFSFVTRNKNKLIVSLILISYFLIWLCFMSMEIRHLWPIYIVTIMLGLTNLITILMYFLKKIQLTYLFFFIIFLYTASVLLLKNIPTESLIVEKTINKILNNKSDPISIDNEINIYLDDYFKSIDINKDIILTNYHFLHMLHTPTISKIRKNLIFYDFIIEDNLIKFDKIITTSSYLLIFKMCESDKTFNLKNKFKLIRKFERSESCLFRRK